MNNLKNFRTSYLARYYTDAEIQMFVAVGVICIIQKMNVAC